MSPYQSLIAFLEFSPENHYDSVVVACLRRVQEWSFVSILSEFRQNTWPHRLLDFEQFIERFDAKLIDAHKHAPDYMLTHKHLRREEMKLIDRVLSVQPSRGPVAEGAVAFSEEERREEGVDVAKEGKRNEEERKRDEEQARIDALLIALLFSPQNTVASPDMHYDPNLRHYLLLLPCPT
jgi:hypothetical protein